MVKFCDQNNTALSSGDDDGLLNDMVTVKCGSCNTVQSEGENCIKVQDCSKGRVRERMSTSQEHEQELIGKCIHIDETAGKAVVSLASNNNIAENCLENICKRPSKDPKVVDMIVEGCNYLHERDHLVPSENLTRTQNLALNRGSLLTPVHRHSQLPDIGETVVNDDGKAELEQILNVPLVPLQVKNESSLLSQYQKPFEVKMPMLLNGPRGIKSCLNPLFSADLSNIPHAESSMNETREGYYTRSYSKCEKMFPTNDDFRGKSNNLIAKINHRNDAKKKKRLIYYVFDVKHTTSPFHGGLFHPNLAINTWLILIENMSPSRDKKVHTAEIEYESNSELGKQVFKTVERPVCQVVKLMEVNYTGLHCAGLFDDIKNVHEVVDVQNLAHRLDYRAIDELENDGVAADDNLNWFFDAYYNVVEAEANYVPAFSNAASEPENICFNRDAELLKYRHLKVIIHPMS